MKISKKRIVAIITGIAMVVTLMPAMTFANDGDNCKTYATKALDKNQVVHVEKKSNNIFAKGNNSPLNSFSLKPSFAKKYGTKDYVNDDDNGDYIDWKRSYDFTLYKGEKLYVDFTMWDTWEDWYTIPSFDVYYEYDDSDFIYTYSPADSGLIVDVDDYNRFTGYFNIHSKSLQSGPYYIALAAMPCDEEGYWAYDLDDFEIPTEWIDFYIKKLPKPSNVKLTVGKRKVKISFKKSKGAKKYEIYRSTSKNKGYKKIATISGNYYTNKGLKKGKRYYYKVRAKRGTSTTGIAYSSYTSPKRSKKVK